MASGDRSVVAVVLIICTFLAFAVFTVGGCVEKSNVLSLKETQMELALKTKCAEMKGTWASVDGDRQRPYACKF